MLGGQSGTPGAHFSRQWANFGSFNAVLYVATEDGKISQAPTEYMWLQEKQRDSQEKNTKANKRELNQKKTGSTPCLYCSGVYSKSKVGEGWMKGENLTHGRTRVCRI